MLLGINVLAMIIGVWIISIKTKGCQFDSLISHIGKTLPDWQLFYFSTQDNFRGIRKEVSSKYRFIERFG